MSVGEPLWPGVVEVCKGPLLKGLRRLPVARYRALGIAGNGFLDPLGRVEPAVAEFDEPPRRRGDGLRPWIGGVGGLLTASRQEITFLFVAYRRTFLDRLCGKLLRAGGVSCRLSTRMTRESHGVDLMVGRADVRRLPASG